MMMAALAALDRGWSVFPVQTRGDYAKKPHWCLIDTGHTKTEDNKVKPSWAALQQTPPTREQVQMWYARPAGKGLAVVTGAVSGLILLDFDGVEGERLRQKLGLPAHVQTGSGGAHVYFEHPGWRVPTLNSKAKREMGRRWPGLDIRADGGYAVMPPSENASGPYIWKTEPGMPELLALSALPEDLRAYLGLLTPPEQPEARTQQPLPRFEGHRSDEDGRVTPGLLIDRALQQVQQGEGRNNAGMWLACQLRDNGYAQGEAAQVMREYAAQTPRHDTHGAKSPYSDHAALATLRSAFSQAPRDPWERQSTPALGTSPVIKPPKMSEPEPSVTEVANHAVVLAGAAFEAVAGALRLPNAEGIIVRQTLTADDLAILVANGCPVYALEVTEALGRMLDASGVEWYALPALPLQGGPGALLEAIQEALVDACSHALTGSLSFLQEDLLNLADARLARGGNTYPTGLTAFDEAVGGGFYDGLHVLGGVTGGGKTALALTIAEHNAREGRPVLFVTYEQSRYELWGRLISTRAGVSLRNLRTGGTAERPVSEQLRSSDRYKDLTDNVAPYLSVIEGNGIDGGAWGVDRIAAQVKRLKAAHGITPLVILDYLQRMPSGNDKDKRHQIDGIVMGLQVKLGRELHTPILLISSVGRGKYGELAASPLEERLSVFKESGGVEYTAYTASLLYPLGLQNALLLGLEVPPLPGSGRAALTGLFKYLVLDLVKNREGEAPQQWVVQWFPATGRFQLLQAVDTTDWDSPDNRAQRSRRKSGDL